MINTEEITAHATKPKHPNAAPIAIAVVSSPFELVLDVFTAAVDETTVQCGTASQRPFWRQVMLVGSDVSDALRHVTDTDDNTGVIGID